MAGPAAVGGGPLDGDSVSFAPGFDMPVFLVTSPAHGGADYVAKRALDVFVSALGLIVLSPLMAIIALAIGGALEMTAVKA